jgi:transcriptional regulator with XRE-family HTH domain
VSALSPARAAREAAGLSLEVAAAKARVSSRYLSGLERSGQFPLHLAERLSRIYGPPIGLSDFLPLPRRQDAKATRRRRGAATTRPNASRGGRV